MEIYQGFGAGMSCPLFNAEKIQSYERFFMVELNVIDFDLRMERVKLAVRLL